jgi:hypothetical protein
LGGFYSEKRNKLNSSNVNGQELFFVSFLNISAKVFLSKVENILKGSLDSISSSLPSVKIQIIGGKVYLR